MLAIQSVSNKDIAIAIYEARRRGLSVSKPIQRRRSFEFRDNCALAQTITDEFILSGPAETGKTVAALHRLHCLMLDYPGSQAAILRKKRVDLTPTCILTFTSKVLPDGWEGFIRKLGGETPERFIYDNGSVIWLGGLDQLGKSLSSERDFIYCNQAEEFSRSDWETLTTRTTGRAGNAPFSFLFGDCNPLYSSKWILERSELGYLNLLETTHENNPFLYDAKTQQWTTQGTKSLGILNKLTGSRRRRLLQGLWDDDSENALWKREWINHVKESPHLYQIVIAVDPTGSSTGDECGIIGIGAARIDRILHVFTLEDGSLQGSPLEWATKAVSMYERLNANWIIVERNFGGDMVRHTIKTVDGGSRVPIKEVHVSRGKSIRAEPISVLYQEGRGHHVGHFPKLEDELCNWVPGDPSPNRLDALVIGASFLNKKRGRTRST